MSGMVARWFQRLSIVWLLGLFFLFLNGTAGVRDTDVYTAVPFSVWGNKPVLAYFVLTPDIAGELRWELDLSAEEFQVLHDVAVQEARQVQRLEGESEAIVSDPQLNHSQKADLITQSGYNQRLQAILRQNQDLLQNCLSPGTYTQLVDWIETRWAQERNRNGVPGVVKKFFGLLAPPPQKTYPRSFEVYATRYEAGDRFIVALPDKCLKFANGGAMRCSEGYQYGQNYSVAISYKGKLVVATVGESGPWNIDDNYWSKLSDPQPRRMFADLPLGVPEAQAAYFNGYNGGVDQFGRVVTSPVAIDISYAVAEELGLPSGNNKVTVSFLWTEGWDQPQAVDGTGDAPADTSTTTTRWQVATPNPDGSIVHVVQQGQTLSGIATVYEVELGELLALNSLTIDSVILPGDRILVREADPTAIGTQTPLSATRTPMLQPTPSATPTTSLQATLLETPGIFTQTADLAEGGRDSQVDPMLAGILVVAALGAMLLIWGLVSQRHG